MSMPAASVLCQCPALKIHHSAYLVFEILCQKGDWVKNAYPVVVRFKVKREREERREREWVGGRMEKE
jgi:hypothetical protein